MQGFQGYTKRLPDMRPQAPARDGSGLIMKTLEHGGEEPDTMPECIEVTDHAGRQCLYVPQRLPAPSKRSQDPHGGRTITLQPRKYGGDVDDDMPQEIKLTDAEGLSCIMCRCAKTAPWLFPCSPRLKPRSKAQPLPRCHSRCEGFRARNSEKLALADVWPRWLDECTARRCWTGLSGCLRRAHLRRGVNTPSSTRASSASCARKIPCLRLA